MRLVVFSDTHGDVAAVDRIFQANPVCDHFLFLGDGIEEVELVGKYYPEKKLYIVAGNCDRGIYPATLLVTLYNTKIFLTHGHYYDVKDTEDKLIQRAHEDNASIILFGHTHVRSYSYAKGVHLLNPGSASKPLDNLPPSYAFIDITPCGISCVHIDV